MTHCKGKGGGDKIENERSLEKGISWSEKIGTTYISAGLPWPFLLLDLTPCSCGHSPQSPLARLNHSIPSQYSLYPTLYIILFFPVYSFTLYYNHLPSPPSTIIHYLNSLFSRSLRICQSEKLHRAAYTSPHTHSYHSLLFPNPDPHSPQHALLPPPTVCVHPADNSLISSSSRPDPVLTGFLLNSGLINCLPALLFQC